MEWLIPLLVGLGVGIVVGALGAGGGILSVPILIYVLGQDPHNATAESLVIVGVTAAVNLIQRALKNPQQIRWGEGISFAAIGVIGTVAGSLLNPLVPQAWLLTTFAALLLAVGLLMLRKARQTRHREAAEATRVSQPDEPVVDHPEPDTTHATGPQPGLRGLLSDPRQLMVLVAAASVTGFLTGFFGVGGGFAVVPALTLALGFSMRHATGTSLLVMVITTAVALLARIGQPVEINWLLVGLFTLGSMVGGLLGGPLAQRARPSTLTIVFGGLLFTVAVWTGVQTWLLG